ncbi:MULTISPECIES: glycosyltransferase family 4 protein [Pseudomonas syringae group]|jgi:glycosyltransferase involved in cell wall biosynthesis|uniref:Glycosyl transferase group 1 n=2 Tax=Pseudomonas syringae group TaxID=136849 RepID=A0A3M4Y771_9PSED|nr:MULTISPECIES: glycosyltransferase family 1 protein [Pseudomonas syringae group]ELS44426.1 MtfB-like family glycosyl transferase [Pseudomonas syringae pv. syringae B64]PBP49441.1 glycosyl transferase family 1 [Pseudomonas syringae]PBQ13122.1 glycosyl transferase family 1 [Pseudomonas syringae]POQ00864.1 glycosyltransferase family 1 protein [Pseudomonas syringae pv. syringae]QVI76309.1 glycosyltransferase family 4 protein [Pseudomonas syringae]
MDIGLSCTVWAKGERAGHLDGIGIYSRALWHNLDKLSQAEDIHVKPYAFGKQLPVLACGQPQQLSSDYRIHAVLSSVLKLPLGNSASIAKDVQLFHATDHHIPRIKGVPVVATIMDMIPVLHPEWIKQDLKRLKSWLFTTSIKRADHIITISEYSKQDMISHLGIAPERISVTPLGVDPVYFQRIGAAERNRVLGMYGLKPGFFLVVGTLQPRKNLQRVLEAFQQLPAQVRKEHPLVIVGRDGWSNEELLPQLEALQQRGEGRWLSYLPQNEVLALLQSAGALVFASLYEGFGLPAIEAFAAQCPLIASNNSSLPEVTGDAAWAVDPHSAESISTAMLAVLEQPEERERKVQSGLGRARHFSWDACAQNTLDIYRKVLAARR